MFVCVADPKQDRVDQGIETEGSNLSGVSAKCVWDDLSRPPEDEDDSRSICVGSQPRRLSDKGTHTPLVKRRNLFLKDKKAFGVFRCHCFGLCVRAPDTEQIREALRKGLEFNTKAALPPISSQRQTQDRPQYVHTHTPKCTDAHTSKHTYTPVSTDTHTDPNQYMRTTHTHTHTHPDCNHFPVL